MRRPVQPHVVLEQELQALLQEEMEGSEDLVGKVDGCDDDAKNAIKKRVRVIKNRLAAKRSREQARTYVQQLESTLNALAAHNEFLARRLAAVEAENDTLKRGFAYRPESVNQKEIRGEPAVLPTSSLQLDGLLLISLLSLCCNHYLPTTCVTQPSRSLRRPCHQWTAVHRILSRPFLSGRLRRPGLQLSVDQIKRLKTRPKLSFLPLVY